MSIKQKMLTLVAGTLAALLLVAGVQIYSLYGSMMHDRRELVRTQVETAASLVAAIAEEARQGRMSVEEAQALAKSMLRTMRFNGTDYFLAIDASPADQGTVLAHPNTALEGKNMWSSRDENGVDFVSSQVNASRNGGGYTEFMFPRLGETVPAPKIAYSLPHAPWQWTISTSLYVDDVTSAFYGKLLTSALWILPLIALIGVAALLLANSISRPIAAITEAMRHLAQGDLSVSVPGAGRKDEIGKMADATEVFRDGMLRAQDLSSAQVEEQRAREQRAQRIEEMTRRFDESATALLTAVTSSAGNMEQNARSMADIAESTNARSTTVATAAQQAAANVQTVASATEELSSSISEIGSQVSKSSQIASQAVGEAQRTDSQIQGLANAAEKIGQVVSMIAAIAEQTNLLALNATIEAARAGEAGRGFAVVAAEVKELASQTSKATEEITSQITAIQSETRIAVGAVQSIGRTVEEMNAIAAAIAAAVEEQGAATGEIARNVEEASRGTQEVTSNILGVSHAASDTRSAAGDVASAAAAVNRDAAALKREVESFLTGVRAA
ncbi:MULTISPECIES: methyl-accepting chemotaxis protein [unclassified Stappia]|uniref:methyl-accepting chemotaxis protein n=1 Tax=unclassified Stappia TaxID=2629676 RepID=UPI001646C005|nr:MULTISPECIES: cache domain-containing protein [unclassified Stappia]